MSWSSNRIPKYRKHRGSGQAIVTLNGRDYYLGPHGTRASKQEYDRLIAEWLVRGRQSIARDAELTLVELIAQYWRHVRKHYVKDSRPTSEQQAIRMALRFARELYWRQPANEFGPLALKAVRERMIAAGLARSTINHNVGRIRRMFRWGVGEQLIEGAHYQSLVAVEGLRQGKSAAKETPPVVAVPNEVVDATIPILPPVVADMVCFQRFTGCRPAEVCQLCPKDINREEEVWQYIVPGHKTEHLGCERIIFIGPQAQGVLLRYLARDSAAYCFRPCDSEQKRRAAAHAARRTPLSCGNLPGSNRKANPKRPPGERYDVASYRRAIHRACDRAFPWPQLAGRKVASLTEEEKAELAKWQSALSLSTQTQPPMGA